MPRGKKAAPAKPPVVVKETKTRKQRTTDPDERIALVDKRIDELEKTIADRRALIAKTETVLDQRRDALVKTEEMLASAQAKKQRIVGSKEAGSIKAYNRQVKATEKAKVSELMEMLKASGKSLDDVLAVLKDEE